MMESRFRGVHTALITPFTDIGTVDYIALERLIDFQIESGIDGLVPCGTTGESPTLSHEEHDRVIKQTIKLARGRVPVIAGTGSNATTEAIRLSQHAEDAGVDAVLLVNPYYNKPTQKGLYEYFKAVAESTDKGIVLYNVPGRTGANLKAETTLALAELPNIVAVKEASGNYSQISEIIRNAPDGFSVLSGNDEETLPLMATGAQGVVSVVSNLFPAEMVQLSEALLKNDMDTARKIHHRLSPFFRNCFVESNPIPVKAAMALCGLIENSLRLPLTPASESTVDLMRRTLDDLNINN